METLGEALPKELSRCRELLGVYKSIGPPGAFAALMLEQSLQAADNAMIEGDLVAMIRCHEDLKQCS